MRRYPQKSIQTEVYRFILSLSVLLGVVPTAHSTPPDSCLQLLGISDEAAPKVSAEAQTFLTLLRVGLDNITTERGALTRNIATMVASVHPVNPFVNLEEPLARALAAKVETLLPQLDSEWSSLQVRVAEQAGEARRQAAARQKDRVSTRVVHDVVHVPVGAETWRTSTSKGDTLDYVGQTRDSYVFCSPNWEDDIGKVFKLSKFDNSFVTLAKIPMGSRGQGTACWMHNGIIYGKGFANGEGSSKLHLFRLDPSTKVGTWAETWDDKSHALYRADVSNTVVGFRMVTNGKIEIFRFDYDRFKFVPTGMSFNVSQAGDYHHSNKFSLVRDIDSDKGKGSLRIGKLLRTDGRVLASPGSLEWAKWNPSDIVRVKNVLGSLHVNAIDASYDQKGRRTVTEFREQEILLQNQHGSWNGNHTFEVFSRGGKQDSILYLYNLYNIGLPSSFTELFAIERRTWKQLPIILQGGPPLNSLGKWKLIRNQKDELLLQFLSEGLSEVALWKFDPRNLYFNLMVHELQPSNDQDDLIDFLFDYETKQPIAWIATGGLLVFRNVDISAREDTP